MGKKNKIRYTSEVKNKPKIVISGNVFLQHQDEENVNQNIKGDFLVYPECRQLQTNRLGEYHNTGFTGYFKIDVYDGNTWQPVRLNEFFENHENHFARTERPMDTYALCKELLEPFKGKTLTRTYREHYILDVAEEAP